jgi:hypothetical protein
MVVGSDETHTRIRRLYSRELKAAYGRLCCGCKHERRCWLLPITSKGEDCPYYDCVSGSVQSIGKEDVQLTTEYRKRTLVDSPTADTAAGKEEGT